VTQISCFGENNGAINLNIIGGVQPITVKWADDSSAGAVRNNLPAGTYNVLVTDSSVNQCPINASFVIFEPAELTLNGIVKNATDCTIVNSGSIDLQVFGGTLPYSFLWNTGNTSEDLNNIPPGNYVVTVTDAHNCKVVQQFTVTRQEPLQIALTTDLIADCDLKEVNQKTYVVAEGGFPPYIFTWSGGNVSGANNEIMTSSQNGTYSIQITDSQGCVYAENFNVEVPYIGEQSFNYTSFSYQEYQVLSIEDPIQFTNNSTGDYLSVSWDFGDNTLIIYDENPTHTYSYADTFVVTQTVEYAVGCTYQYSRQLTVNKGYELINPNGFTPNGDGINDVIRPSYKGLISIEMSIYDTWGSLIYYEEGPILQGWDGMLNGDYAENGNYVMVVKGTTFYKKQLTETTSVTLLR
jgi:gliding motility-associated-like protein